MVIFVARFPAQEAIYDEFVKRAAARAAKRTVGAGLTSGAEQGPQGEDMLRAHAAMAALQRRCTGLRGDAASNCTKGQVAALDPDYPTLTFAVVLPPRCRACVRACVQSTRSSSTRSSA